MDLKLENFFKKIGFYDEEALEEFKDAFFLDIQSLKGKSVVCGTIKLRYFLSYRTYVCLFNALDKFSQDAQFKIELKFVYDDISDDNSRLSNIIINLISETFLEEYKIIDDKIIFYYTNNPKVDDSVEILEHASNISKFLSKISCPYNVFTQEKIELDDIDKFVSKKEEEYKKDAEDYNNYIREKEIIDSTYQPCKLKDIEIYKMVIVEGVIFFAEDTVTKSNKLIRRIGICDNSDAVYVTLFERKNFPVDEISKYKQGVKVKIYGRPRYDTYIKELALNYDKIEIVDNPITREDSAPVKRVELHLHTKMSPFDGVSDIDEYVKMAKHFNMETIAITDHDGVQAFPAAQKAAKKNDIKMIYGCEFSMIDDKKKLTSAIYNPSDKKLAKSSYVVFDTETTGLSCRYDDIIEFGAVKYSSSFEKIDEIDFFIKSDKELSSFTIKTSNITQDDVDNGKDIKDALNIIKEFFEDCILVAHNAAFDYDFINEKLRENNMEEIKNPVIDTLPLARYIYPDFKRYREESIANALNISFSSSEAHRANYDARHLGEIFQHMLSALLKIDLNIKHKDIAEFEYEDKTILSLHPNHVTVYAKNQQGIKDLYSLVSDASIKHLNKQGNPILLKSILNDKRENLLIGSACLNGEVFEKACNKSLKQLEESMNFFDFIEVQPPQIYKHLINKGEIDNEKELQSILKDIIYTAKKLNKVIVATGDCHYVNKEEKIFRDVMIATKGLRGVRHPLCMIPKVEDTEVLNNYYKNSISNPDQEFLSTDEMIDAFSFLNDNELVDEIVVKNSNKIASMFDKVSACKDGTYPPSLPGSDEKLKDLVYTTAKNMYGDPLPPLIEERLETELKGIIGGGYSVHYYLSSIIIKWCNDLGYIVGSRGSVGSSLVATMSGITEVNPLPPHYYCPKCHHIEWADVLQYESGTDLPIKDCPNCHTPLVREGQNIPFATFLGFKAEKVPDIDLNFPSDFQADAHSHMREILNKTGNTCYKAGTIQTVQDKKAIGYALGYFRSIGKQENKVRGAYVNYLASGICGVKVSTGQHPGGIIVIPKGMEVTDFTPIQFPAGKIDSDWETTHFDFHAIHDNVLKFDMLAHQDPVAIKMMCNLCNIKISDLYEKIPLTDSEALSVFWSTDVLHLKNNLLNETNGALGLPEFGTEIGRRTLIETKAHSFADLVRISGLSHGTDVYAGNARDLILDEGKSLRDVIACRDDIMIRLHDDYGIEYTDSFQIMEIVRKGNFCKPEFKEKREKYTALMREHNVPEYYIHSCEKIKYLFPRGHAVAYVSMAVRVAFFKVHYPLEYYATYFSIRADAFDILTMQQGLKSLQSRLENIKTLIETKQATNTEAALVNTLEQAIEMYDRGMCFDKMTINTCHSSQFLVNKENNSLIPPLNIIEGVGLAIADPIYEERMKNGPFTSIENLVDRTKIGASIVKKFREYGLLENLKEDDQLTLFDFL